MIIAGNITLNGRKGGSMKKSKNVSKVEQLSTEELIISLCRNYCKETKKARKEEQLIIKELVHRDIVDSETMIQLLNV